MTDGMTRHDSEAAMPRRRLLQLGLAAVATTGGGMTLAPGAADAALYSLPRHVKLHNLHTGEKIDAEYWVRGQYVPDALHAIDWVLRDHYTDEVRTIHPRLIDFIFHLHTKVGATRPFSIVSAYRSPTTNARLRRNSSGVARNSFHMYGKAVDLRLDGANLTHLCRTARNMRAGGVGFYPRSNFIHCDVGPVRQW